MAIMIFSPVSNSSHHPLVMSPELKDFQLGSARDLFHISSELKIDQKRAKIMILVGTLTAGGVSGAQNGKNCAIAPKQFNSRTNKL